MAISQWRMIVTQPNVDLLFCSMARSCGIRTKYSPSSPG
jgi:hypothetical protein